MRPCQYPAAAACIQAAAAFFSYPCPAPLLPNRNETGGTLVRVSPHNLREGFHALYALARYRNSARARQVADAKGKEAR